MKIVFNLPGRGGGGGSHSVVQEAIGLKRLGLEADIATNRDTSEIFRATYPDLEQNGVALHPYDSYAELLDVAGGYDVVVSTTSMSAADLAEALAADQRWAKRPPKLAYYIQDYEPFFYRPGGDEWRRARASYDALPNALLFAKTDWLCHVVARNHNRFVARVQPSLDRAVYYPDLGRRPSDVVTIIAMARPGTPRRAPRRTMRILDRIAVEFGPRVRVVSFGSDAADLAQRGFDLNPDIERLGVLTRAEVADALRRSDLFLDLSDYQAFGRTGLEAMACGCVPLLPVFGGASEFAADGENGFLVDTRSDERIMKTVRDFVSDSLGVRGALRQRAIETSFRYSVETACYSEFLAFQSFFGAIEARSAA